MDVFISWSGERSGAVAEALRNWIPKMINAVKPWLSSSDIDKGARWSTDVASKLETSKVGIICLTPENVHADWILFEAGALSKTLQNTFVCPLLVDLQPSDIRGPLAQFQSTRATKEEIKKLLITINSALVDNALSQGHLDEAFEVWWPRLEERLNNLPATDAIVKPQRPDRDILEEILALVRNQARSVAIGELVSREAVLREAAIVAVREVGLAVQNISFARSENGLLMKIALTNGAEQVVLLPHQVGSLPVVELRRLIHTAVSGSTSDSGSGEFQSATTDDVTAAAERSRAIRNA